MKITKQQVLDNLDTVKEYISEAENKKEEKTIGIAIKNRFTGEIIFQSTKTTYREAIIEKGDADLCGANLRGADLRDADLYNANLRDADLCGADLYNANLRDAELMRAKFYGKGGNKVIMKKDLEGFLGALGFKLE